MRVPSLSTPPLEPPYGQALVEALEYIFEIHEDVVAINLAGSVAMGEADARSDIDLYVIIGGDKRHRDQRLFGGVPVEMFFPGETGKAGPGAGAARGERARGEDDGIRPHHL